MEIVEICGETLMRKWSNLHSKCGRCGFDYVENL